MKSNVKIVAEPVFTHGGSRAFNISPEMQLRRSVMSCLLFEDAFYEDGVSVADRIRDLVSKVRAETVADIAIEARSDMHLRHVPLMLASQMALMSTHKHVVGKLLPEIIQRADEVAEFCSLYQKLGGKKLTAQAKKGLAKALQQFDEYQLSKWKSEGNAWSLRDVMFLTHAKPLDGRKGYTKHVREAILAGGENEPELSPGEILFKKLTQKDLAIADTWETNLSAGKGKRETFERLMAEKKLGVMAFLRNLRNMEQAGISRSLVKEYATKAFNGEPRGKEEITGLSDHSQCEPDCMKPKKGG